MSDRAIVGLNPWLPRLLSDRPWWTVPIRAERLAALRIGIAAVLLIDILGIYLPYASDFFGSTGIGVPQDISDLLSGPNWPFLRGVDDLWTWRAILILWALAAFCLLIGFHTRISTIVTWLLAMLIATVNPWIRNTGDNVMVGILFLLMFGPGGAVWSLDRRLKRARPESLPVPGGVPDAARPLNSDSAGICIYPWLVRLFFLQLCVIYFMNGILKCMDPSWRDGTALYYVTTGLSWTRWSGAELPVPFWITSFLTWFTLAWEAGFPVLVMFRRTRLPSLWIGVLFHVGTGIALMLGPFPLYMLCLYLPLVPWEKYVNPPSAEGATSCP